MGRESRANKLTAAEAIAQTPHMPRRLRFALTHPRAGCVMITIGFVAQLPYAAALGIRELWRKYRVDLHTFLTLARGDDAP